MPREQTIQVTCDVPARMRDGTVLRANIFQPANGGPYPVLLTRLPYGKDLPIGSLFDPLRIARSGFIVVVQDTRGRAASEGAWDPFANETKDGYDTVTWAAGLANSTGDVGMYGVSYFGFTQWAAARLAPPALKALFPMITWRDSTDGVLLRGGALELGTTASWALQMQIDVVIRANTGDPAALGAGMARVIGEIDNLQRGPGFRELPLASFGPLTRVGIDFTSQDTMRHPTTARALEYTRVGGVPERTNAPAFHIGGWYDIFLKGTLDNFVASRRRDATEEARRSRLLIGPWSHTTMGARIGEQYFGTMADAQFVDLTGLLIRWFGATLKNLPDPLLAAPPVRIFVMGENVWRDEQEWPLQRAVPTTYYLHAPNGQAQTRTGDGLLSQAPPDGNGATSSAYVYDPNDPVPTLGGATLIGAAYPAGPHDQRPIEDRQDVLCFTTPPLEQDLELTGPLTARLWVTSSAPDTDFVARLVDVHPDGYARNLSDGIIRARYRDGLERPQLLTPEHPTLLTIDLWATSNLFRAGNRIRLDITSSSFPRWDRNLSTGEDPATATDPRPAEQRILHDPEHPSYIVLPVIPR